MPCRCRSGQVLFVTSRALHRHRKDLSGQLDVACRQRSSASARGYRDRRCGHAVAPRVPDRYYPERAARDQDGGSSRYSMMMLDSGTVSPFASSRSTGNFPIGHKFEKFCACGFLAEINDVAVQMVCRFHRMRSAPSGKMTPVDGSTISVTWDAFHRTRFVAQDDDAGRIRLRIREA